MSKKRIMVDMSATLIHHGHIRIIKSAAQMGQVVVGMTSDIEVEQRKGYVPELCFDERKEILLALSDVSEVVQTPWLITEAILDNHNIDLLVHGDDNSNNIAADRLVILPRTEGVSSWQLREKAARAVVQKLREELGEAGQASAEEIIRRLTI